MTREQTVGIPLRFPVAPYPAWLGWMPIVKVTHYRVGFSAILAASDTIRP